MGHAMKAIGKGINAGEGVFGFGPDSRTKKNIQQITSTVNGQIQQQQDILNPPMPTPPPTLGQAESGINQSAANAAAAQRRRASATSGYAGTILTPPSAPPPNAGQRKTLLGV